MPPKPEPGAPLVISQRAVGDPPRSIRSSRCTTAVSTSNSYRPPEESPAAAGRGGHHRLRPLDIRRWECAGTGQPRECTVMALIAGQLVIGWTRWGVTTTPITTGPT